MHRRLMLAAGLGALASPALAQANDPENTLILELKDGRVTIQMLPDLAPRHVERIKALARRGFYDNTVFHRVLEGFMAQGGDPTGTGQGGSDLPDLPAEFNMLPHVRGTVSMARATEPDSANSQFFINFSDNNFLNGQYTVYGRVIEGMAHVDKIARGEPPASPDRILSMKVAADV